MAARRVPTAPVSERALFQRIARKLRAEDKYLKACRDDMRAFRDLGRYYVVESRRGLISRTHVDLVALAKELGVLRPWERMDADG